MLENFGECWYRKTANASASSLRLSAERIKGRTVYCLMTLKFEHFLNHRPGFEPIGLFCDDWEEYVRTNLTKGKNVNLQIAAQ